MPRKHLFTLLVLTGAAAVVGLVALTSTVELGQAAKASSTSDPAIGYRLQQLDGLESDLRRQLADSSAPAAAPAETVYRRAAAPLAATPDRDSDSEDDQYERESEDDQREYDHEDHGDDRDEHEDERDD